MGLDFKEKEIAFFHRRHASELMAGPVGDVVATADERQTKVVMIKTPTAGIPARTVAGIDETNRDEYELGTASCTLISTYDPGPSAPPVGPPQREQFIRDPSRVRSVRRGNAASGINFPSGSTWQSAESKIDVFNPFDEDAPGDAFLTAIYLDGSYVLVSIVTGDTAAPGGGGGGSADCEAVFACFDGRCCDHGSTDRCMYKRDAIKTINLDDNAGRTWKQSGRSTFSSINDCTWAVPVTDQNCVAATATVERTTTGWTVSVLTEEWESTSGPSACTDEVSDLTTTGGGTGDIKFEHDGNCPTTGCCEDLRGTIVPRITISGIPEMTQHSYPTTGTVPAFYGACTGQTYDVGIARPGAMNGVFHGPPMIPNPGGTDLGLVWEDNITVCQDIHIPREFYNAGNLICAYYGALCDDPVNPAFDSSYVWTQAPGTGAVTFQSTAGGFGGIQSINVGDGCFANNGGAFSHAFPPMSCTSGSTWRDYEVIYTDTVRYISLSQPAIAGRNCWDIEIIADFVEA